MFVLIKIIIQCQIGCLYQQKTNVSSNVSKTQVNLSEPLYQMTRDLPVQFNSICSSPKHGDIYDCKFSFLERAKLFIFI